MPRLCDNVWFQAVGECAADYLTRGVPKAPMHRFVHVCNPYDIAARQSAAAQGSATGLSSANLDGMSETQAVTYAAMKRSREDLRSDCRQSCSEVEFLGAVFPSDEKYASNFFDRTAPLWRSAVDLHIFTQPRPVPLLFDILSAARNSDADYVIFTNVDICPVPHFYRTVAAILATGYDALVINRRTLAGWPIDPGLLDFMAMDHGRPHEGYDCFVFKRKALDLFVTNEAVVGSGGVMQSLIYNLVATSQRLLILGDVHLTYHLGDDKVWTAPHLRDYIKHNWTEAISTLRLLASANPERFRDFCRTFPQSRVDVRVERDGLVYLEAKQGLQGFLPNLEAINSPC